MTTRLTVGQHTKGFDELERNLKELGPLIATKLAQSATRKAMKDVAEPALKAAAPVGPRPEGQVGTVGTRKDGSARRYPHRKIKNNIKVKKGRSKVRGEGGAVVTLVTTGPAFHAIFQEKGTVHIPAQPFAQRAIDGVSQKIIDTLGTELGKGIERHVRRSKK